MSSCQGQLCLPRISTQFCHRSPPHEVSRPRSKPCTPVERGHDRRYSTFSCSDSWPCSRTCSRKMSTRSGVTSSRVCSQQHRQIKKLQQNFDIYVELANTDWTLCSPSRKQLEKIGRRNSKDQHELLKAKRSCSARGFRVSTKHLAESISARSSNPDHFLFPRRRRLSKTLDLSVEHDVMRTFLFGRSLD
eukprot:scpid87555/ scgid25033/ 